jgi:hypothetical protein
MTRHDVAELTAASFLEHGQADATELAERKLRMELMQADIDNRQDDTRCKVTLTRVEPWKVIVAVVIAAATAIGGLAGYKLGSMPPQQIIIQQPAAK